MPSGFPNTGGSGASIKSSSGTSLVAGDVLKANAPTTGTPGSGSAQVGFLALDSNGDAVGNIIPRTDTRANLLALSGRANELSSATDSPTIVKHNGSAGGAVAVDSFGSVYRVVNAAPANGSTVTFPSWPQRILYGVNIADTREITIELSAGYVEGQEISFSFRGNDGFGASNLTFGSSVLAADPVVYPRTTYGLRWQGALWSVISFSKYDSTGFSLAGGSVLAGGVAIGQGASSEGINAIVMSGAANNIVASSDNDYAFGFGKKAAIFRNMLFTTTVNSTAQAELTLDGAAATALNRFSFGLVEGRARAKITVFGQIGTGDEMWSNEYTVLLDISTLGDVSLASAVVAGTAIPGLTTTNMGTPTWAIGVTSGKLTVKVTPAASSASSTVKWYASLDILEFLN